MTTHQIRARSFPMTRPRRTVTVVNGHPDAQALNRLLTAIDHDVVFVESLGHAYSQIKRRAPDLVILCLSGDDLDGCQVLSMLTLDAETSRIPVLTIATAPSDGSAANASEHEAPVFPRFAPLSPN